MSVRLMYITRDNAFALYTRFATTLCKVTAYKGAQVAQTDCARSNFLGPSERSVRTLHNWVESKRCRYIFQSYCLRVYSVLCASNSRQVRNSALTAVELDGQTVLMRPQLRSSSNNMGRATNLSRAGFKAHWPKVTQCVGLLCDSSMKLATLSIAMHRHASSASHSAPCMQHFHHTVHRCHPVSLGAHIIAVHTLTIESSVI
jgi:hypothetical protein